MDNDTTVIKDDGKRKSLWITLPVVAVFAALVYYFVSGTPKPAGDRLNRDGPTFLDTDADGIADHIDHCPQVEGTMQHNGCLPTPSRTDTDNSGQNATPETNRSVKESTDSSGSQAATEQGESSPAAISQAISDNASQRASDAVEQDSTIAINPEDDTAEIGTLADALETPEADGADEPEITPEPNVTPEPETTPGPDVTPGVADKDDKCPDIAGAPGNAGCPRSTQTNDTSIALTPKQAVTQSEERLIQDAGFNIQFNAGNTVLTDQSRDILLEVAKVMQRYPDIALEAHGFTDSEGSTQQNIRLSQARAEACINVIAEAGIDASRLSAIGFGEQRPIAPNTTSAGRQKNRRVEFKLVR